MSESFGSYLKRERELRNISLEEVAQQTHVQLAYLQAMESDRFEKLPGFTFARGYVRAYAECIGLNSEETLLHFEEYLKSLSGMGKSRRRPTASKFWEVLFLLFLLLSVGAILLWLKR